MRDILGMMKQAKELQGKMQQMQEEIGLLAADGSAGGGLVTVTLNGRNEAKAVHIDASLIKPEEVEVLEDLIVAAINDARGKIEQQTAERMQALTGGLGLPPGLKF